MNAFCSKVDAGSRADEPAKAFAEKHGYIYAEGSAKTGVGIEEAFSKLAAAMVMRRTRMRCGGRIQGEGKGGRQEERG